MRTPGIDDVKAGLCRHIRVASTLAYPVKDHEKGISTPARESERLHAYTRRIAGCRLGSVVGAGSFVHSAGSHL
jgi:hypothetical protein